MDAYNKNNDSDYERVQEAPLSCHGSTGSMAFSDRRKIVEDVSFLGSLWLACKKSTPTILTMIFFQMVQLLNILYVGQMSSDLLAGVGLGNMLLNVLVFAVTMGLNGTVETFVSWSFGKNDKAKCGIHLNRARVIVSVYMMPVIIIFLFMDKILIAAA
mgnify:CR=1 FL=1